MAYKVAEELLRDMLAECQSWRAYVANPTATWAALDAAIEAGGIAEGDAAARVVIGAFDEEADPPLERPRAVIRQFDASEWQRDSTTGFSGSLPLQVTLELTVDPAHLDATLSTTAYENAVILDARRKVSRLRDELASLPRQAGRVDMEGVTLGYAGPADPDESGGEDFAVAEFVVLTRGTF